MNVLVLGGTQFIGQHLVEALVAAGHKVSMLNRGKSPDELPTSVERLRGDRDEGITGLSALGQRTWDVCVDVSGLTAVHVHTSAALLSSRVGRYVFVSTTAVYADLTDRPVTESSPLLPPAAEDVTEVDRDTYGPLKVTCERIVESIYGNRSAILRPQIVAGPLDYTYRYPYWIKRTAAGGEILAPGDGSDHLQVVDARDIARFVLKIAQDDIDGIFNMAGPRMTWSEYIALLGAENVVWVGADVIKSAGLTEQQVPLYRHDRGERSGLMHVSADAAINVGFAVSNPEVTLRDTKAWCVNLDIPLLLSPEQERELIRIAKGA